MSGKKILIVAMVLNTMLLAFAASFSHRLPWQLRDGGGGNDRRGMALTGPGGKFGPVIETVLPAARAKGSAAIVDILNLETGRSLVQPPLESFNSRADAIMRWIRSNGLDISCVTWSSGATCVTYDMTIVPVEGKCWEETTEEALLSNPALTPVRHAPRRLLVLGDNRPDTYIFRTAEGTLGMLQIAGVSQHGQGVKIRYKLINSAQSVATKG
jgi:hypothetical protein